MRLTIDQQTPIIILTGELDMVTAQRPANAVTHVLKKLAPTSSTRVILDLHAISFVDASGIGGLVAAHNTATTHGLELVLRGVSPQLRRLLTITALYEHFTHD